MRCNHCDGTGFLNSSDKFAAMLARVGPEKALELLAENPDVYDGEDICGCDCCGGEDGWHGTPGEHYTDADPQGPNGPYAYNGGLCECH